MMAAFQGSNIKCNFTVLYAFHNAVLLFFKVTKKGLILSKQKHILFPVGYHRLQIQ